MNLFCLISFVFSLVAAIPNSSSKSASKKCSRQLERVIGFDENDAISFMRRMYLSLLDEGTASALVKRFANNNRVIVKISNAFGKMTSITVPVGMESFVKPEMVGPIKDVSGIRAYALGNGFDNNVKSELLVYSGKIIKSDGRFNLVTVYVPKTRFNVYNGNLFKKEQH